MWENTELDLKAARKAAGQLVDAYLGCRKAWPEPWYATPTTRRRAIRTLTNLILRNGVDWLNRVYEVAKWYGKNDLLITDYPYAVTNFFGQRARWMDAEANMRTEIREKTERAERMGITIPEGEES